MNAYSNLQKEHYGKLIEEYDKYYYDKYSMRYRKKYMYDVMFRDMDFNDKDVAEVACGGGYNSAAFLSRFPTAKITGFDISQKACERYLGVVKRQCVVLDITCDDLPLAAYDLVFVIGGMHHCVNAIENTIDNIARSLRPGGVFIMFEPNGEFLLDKFRVLWYRVDKLFDAKSERAFSHDYFSAYAKKHFQLMDVVYGGGPGYFLVLNSMIFRIPYSIKSLLANPIFKLEYFYNKLSIRSLLASYVSRWLKY